jgi:hypothetical protein
MLITVMIMYQCLLEVSLMKPQKRDFIEGAKWQAEKMYSEEDLIELLQNCWSESAINLAQQTNKEEYITFSEWIEKNL